MTRPDETDLSQDAELMAYVDGSLPPERMAEIEARLARDAEARDAVAQWRHFDNLIHATARGADAQPASLQIAALERQLASRLQRRRWRGMLLGPGLRQIAASVVIFAAGWGAHGLYERGLSGGSSAYPSFAQSTLAGYNAYLHAAAETAAFDGAHMTEALAWLSEQMQHQIESPQLERLGYSVESARLVMVDDQPVAVFYYRNPQDERVTVSMTPRGVMQPEYALRVVPVQGGRMAYWSGGNLNYVVVASADPAQMTSLAAAVQR